MGAFKSKLANPNFKSKAACVSLLIGFNKSLVLFTRFKPTIALSIPVTFPVNIGEAKGAFKAKDSVPTLSFNAV